MFTIVTGNGFIVNDKICWAWRILQCKWYLFFLLLFFYSPAYQSTSMLHCASNRRSSYLSFLSQWPLTFPKVALILLFLCVWYISLVISHYPSSLVFAHGWSYSWRSVHQSTNSLLLETKCALIISLSQNSLSIAQNSEADIILSASDCSNDLLPELKWLAVAKHSPSGVFKIHPKTMLWKLTDFSDIKRRNSC